MTPHSLSLRLPLVLLASVVLALSGLACSSSSDSDAGPLALETSAVWVGEDSGLLQCLENKVTSLDGAIWEFDVAGVTTIEARQGTPRHLSTCPECSCTALVYNFLAIDASDVTTALTLGYTVFDAKDVSFF